MPSSKIRSPFPVERAWDAAAIVATVADAAAENIAVESNADSDVAAIALPTPSSAGTLVIASRGYRGVGEYRADVPEVLPPPADATERLGRLAAFSSLTPEIRASLADSVTWIRFHGGEVLFAEGALADAAYFIIRGRVRVTQVDADLGERLVGERASGEPVGEVGVLADVVRTATVRAVRDTDLVRIDRATFDSLLRERPETMVPLVQVVAGRLAEALRGRDASVRRVSTIAILLDRPTASTERALDELTHALGHRVPLARIRVQGGGDDHDLVSAIDEQQSRGGLTTLEVDVGTAGPGAAQALRQADSVVVVAEPAASAVAGPVGDALVELSASGCSPSRIIVLVQPSGRAQPVATARRVVGFDEHFHVRLGAHTDFERVARHLTGAAVALVLGGGGARALSHVGAYDVLVDAAVPIDAVGGSSIGGVIAAQIAAGWSPEELMARNRTEWPAARLNRRITVPLMSLLSPEAAMRMLDRMFGTSDFEDLWLPCFVTAVDLTDCRLVVKRSGSLTRWTLATQSPPGIWPPVVGEDGALYTDGAVVDNLPVLPMRASGARRVIAISVSRRPSFRAGAAIHRAPSPVAFARDLARPRAERADHAFPNLLGVLYRTALVTGLERHAASQAASDIYVEPDVDEFAIGDYARIDEIVPRGTAAMRSALSEHGDLVGADAPKGAG
jgi:predicted acylesterase/phospholipase RssA/CRP-like cAMP-binding protein